MTELIKENTLFLAINLLVVPVLLAIPAIPTCLTMNSTSYKNCYYSAVSMTELIKENALFIAINLLVVPVLLAIPAVNVPGSILCIAKFIDELKRYYSFTALAKNV